MCGIELETMIALLQLLVLTAGLVLDRRALFQLDGSATLTFGNYVKGQNAVSCQKPIHSSVPVGECQLRSLKMLGIPPYGVIYIPIQAICVGSLETL